MSDVFGADYSNAYNSLYSDKNYAAECDVIEGLFKRYSQRSVRKILDLGCGTGNHAFLFANRDYDVVGVERSQHMLAVAQNKLDEKTRPKLQFRSGDIRNVDLGEEFDAALILFAVLGYQLENSDVIATLRTARRHLKPGGLLIFDVWYGPAVLREQPSDRAKVIPTPDGKILRLASGKLETATHTCSVQYQLWQFQNDRVNSETQETHRMRYFFPKELDLFLEHCGFTRVRLGAFPDVDREPSESTWNVIGVARAV